MDSSTTRLACRGEEHFTERQALRKAGEHLLHLGLHHIQRQPKTLKNGGSDAFTAADEAKKHVLGADEVVPQPSRFFRRQDDNDSPRLFGRLADGRLGEVAVHLRENFGERAALSFQRLAPRDGEKTLRRHRPRRHLKVPEMDKMPQIMKLTLVTQQYERLAANLVQPCAEGLEDLGGNRLALFHEPQE